MALNNNFMQEALRMAQREAEARRRDKAALDKVSANSAKLDRSNAIWDQQQGQQFAQKLEGTQQAGRENLERIQQSGALDVAKVNADASTKAKASAGAFTPNQVADLRRNSLNDARDEILGMADASGNIPNPMYLDKDGKPSAGQPQFLDQAGVQEMIDRRSMDLYQSYTNGLMDSGQAAPQAAAAPGVAPITPEAEQLKGFTGLNAGNDDYQKNIIRSMVNADGQPGGDFKKFSMNGSQQAPVVPVAAPILNPGNAQAAPSGGTAGAIQAMANTQAVQASEPGVPKSLYSRFMKPVVSGIKTQASNIRDVMSWHGGDELPPASVVKKKKPFTIPTTTLTNQEIMAKRGNKPIDRAFNLFAR
ncbi:MAG: hypothetical protein KKF30_10455 [Proteobacteria bacterium]|nr:hypothetical protein [Pseudomonadota bacterium]MBU4470314.1 hypothetical protein [Pseudomonadota bacterium]MCG2752726.1 hypothetical protein [Desulfobacteraceae bacterium]